jgi:hypothetical protein
MSIRERTEDDDRSNADEPDDQSANSGLIRARLAGQSFLSAGADAIQKALSSDSRSFLAATRQQGGQ